MNFYISLLNRQEKLKDENPSIGIIICADKDNLEVELALEDIEKPIGVTKFELYVPQKELKQLISDEIETYNKEISAAPRHPLSSNEADNHTSKLSILKDGFFKENV